MPINLDKLLRPSEDLGRQILSEGPVLNPRVYEPIGLSEIAVAERPECLRLALRPLHEFPIFGAPSSPGMHRLDYPRVHGAVNPAAYLRAIPGDTAPHTPKWSGCGAPTLMEKPRVKPVEVLEEPAI